MGNRVLALRTARYCEGILAGAWVLSPAWITESFGARQWLPQATYEVQGDHVALAGPEKGREHGPCLFSGMRLYILNWTIDPDYLKSDVVERIILRGGGEFLSEIAQLPDAGADP